MNYAILYEKINYNKDKIIFKASRVLKGYFDSKNQIFLDEENEERILISDLNILNKQTGVGNIVTEEELLKCYPVDIIEAKEQFFKDVSDILYVGFIYDDKIEIGQVENPFVLNNDNQEMLDPYYQQLKKYQFKNDFTIFTIEEIEELLTINDIRTIKSELENIRFYKSSYQEKYNNHHCFVLCDDDINYLLKISNLNKLKNEIHNFKNIMEEHQNAIEQDGFTFLDFYQNINMTVVSSNNLEFLKNVLEDNITTYNNLIQTLSQLPLEEEEYNLCKKVMEIQIGASKGIINNSEDLNSAINDYQNIYQTSLNLVKKVNEILCDNNYLLEVKSIVDVDKTVTEEEIDDLKSKLSFDYLDVYSKLTEKIVGREAQLDAILSNISMTDENHNTDKKNACLIAGTTGTGKTQTFKEIKRLFTNRPVVIVDTNQITQEGYVGGSIEQNIVAPLIKEAHRILQTDDKKMTKEDIILAEHGIIFLDEIDKRRENLDGGADVNGSGVVDGLLKLIDGTDYNVTIGQQMLSFNSSNLVIFAGGAFQEYFELSDKKIGIRTEKDSQNKIKIDPEELVKYGLSSQFIGRFTNTLLYPTHDEKSLMAIEKNKKTSNIENKRLLFKELGVDLVWDDEFLTKSIQKAVSSKKGSRGYQAILANCVDEAYSEIKKYPNTYKIVYLTQEALENEENVVLVKKDGTIVMMFEVLKRNQEASEKLYEKNHITVDESALQEVQKRLKLQIHNDKRLEK